MTIFFAPPPPPAPPPLPPPQVLSDPKQHASQVVMVFEKLVETTMGVTKEEMSQPAFAGLGSLSYPELHDVSFALYGTSIFVCLCVPYMVPGTTFGWCNAAPRAPLPPHPFPARRRNRTGIGKISKKYICHV